MACWSPASLGIEGGGTSKQLTRREGEGRFLGQTEAATDQPCEGRATDATLQFFNDAWLQLWPKSVPKI